MSPPNPADRPTQIPAISAHGLSYRYAGAATPALQNVSFEVPAGEIFGLLGPNGAGKSTLLSILSGSLTSQSGDITIAGERLTGRAHAIKQLSAVVPQEYAFYDSLTGRQNLDYFGSVFGLSRASLAERRARAVEICRLEEHLDRPASEYSGGLKRRLNLAIGLLNAPKILYLDEPTVGIDAQSRRFIIEAVHALKDAGTTIIYTSHYMEEVEELCDSVAVIDHGRLVMCDRMENLLRREGGQTLLITFVAPQPELAEVFAPFGATHVEHREWTLQIAADRLPQLLRTLTERGIAIDRMQYGVSRLEKIYLELLLGSATQLGDAA
jgi:ABC-2 type transport system ATP-binding protein